MNLEEFVRDVLVSLDLAVEQARRTMNRDISFTANRENRTIEFDIAISAEETDSKSGKAGVRVLQFPEGGGEISKENKNSTVSRIKFGIYIDSSTKQESEKNRREIEQMNERNQREAW